MEFWVRYLALFRLFSAIDSFKWFWKRSSHRNTQLIAGVSQGSILDPTLPTIH